MRTALSIAIGTALALTAPFAMAQDAPPTGTGTGTGPVGGPVEGSGSLPPPTTSVQTQVPIIGGPPSAAPAGPKPEEDVVSDHEKVVGHVAVGYLGLTSIPIDPPAAGASNVVNAPVIGIRYWLAEKIGLDIGLGLGLTSASVEQVTGPTTTTIDSPSVFGGALHGGVPLVFAHAKHFKFLLVPELNFGFATATQKTATAANPLGPDISHTGFLFNVGGRIGSEIHFGFIGVPQLSLQATVGFFVTAQNRKQSADLPGGGTNSVSTSQFGLGTTVQSDPWALFANSISALYYFP